MTRVAPFAQQQLILFHTLNTQARLSDRQLQLASGKVAQTYSGIAASSSRLLSIEADRSRAMQYIDNIDVFAHRLSVADLALAAIDTGARNVRGALDSILNYPDSHAGDLRQMAADARDLVRDMLNTQDGGRYLFSGTRTDHRPVSLDAATYASIGLIEADGVTVDETFYRSYYTDVLGNSLPYAQGSFYQQIYFEKNGVLPAGPLPADLNNPTTAEFVAEDPDLFQFYVDRLDSAAMLATPKLDYYDGDTGFQTVRADDNLEATLPVRADQLAFQQILAALDAIANLPDDQPDTDAEKTVVAKARNMLNVALGTTPSPDYDSLGALRIDVASTQTRLATFRDRHENFAAYAEGTIADIENIDEAEVIVRLQNDRTALEAAFSAIAELQSLSLLNYM